MVDFEEEVFKLKQEVELLKQNVVEINGKLDSEVDGFLAKVQKSSVTWLIVLGAGVGAFTLGALLF